MIRIYHAFEQQCLYETYQYVLICILNSLIRRERRDGGEALKLFDFEIYLICFHLSYKICCVAKIPFVLCQVCSVSVPGTISLLLLILETTGSLVHPIVL